MLRTVIDAVRLKARPVALLVAGATFYALYLDYALDPAPPEVRQFWRWSWPAFAILNLIGFRVSREEPSTGAMVTLAGLIGTSYLALNYRTSADLLIGGAIIITAMLGFYLLGRLEQRHRGQIGEARFGSDGKPLGPWQSPES